MAIEKKNIDIINDLLSLEAIDPNVTSILIN